MNISPNSVSDDHDSDVESETSNEHSDLSTIEYWSIEEYQRMILFLCAMSSTYVFSSAITFHSGFQEQVSNLDVLAVMNETYLIDITSVAFVLAGYASGQCYTRQPELLLSALTTLAVDIWLFSAVSLVVGPIYAFTINNFSWKSICLTSVEALFLTRCLDFNQAKTAPHNLNVSSWPVSALFVGLMGMPHTIATGKYIDRLFENRAGLAALCMAMAGISLFSVFASAHSESNVFYANSTSAMYRCLEFNLGVHIQHLVYTADSFIMTIAHAGQRLTPIAVLLFLLIWWVEVGVSWMPYPLNCVRMYHFSPCIQAHHGLLVRGCVLGMMACCCLMDIHSSDHEPEPLPRHANHTFSKRVNVTGRVCLSAVSMSWPVFIMVDLVMQITFDRKSVRSNATFLVPVYTIIVFGLAYLYQKHVRRRLHNAVYPKVHRLATIVVNRCATPPLQPFTSLPKTQQRTASPPATALADAHNLDL